MTKWRASGIARQASQWKSFCRREPGADADLRSDIMSSMKGVSSVLLQAQGIMKQLNEAADELFMQVRSHMCHVAWIWVHQGGVLEDWGAWGGEGVHGAGGASRLRCIEAVPRARRLGSQWVRVHCGRGALGLGCIGAELHGDMVHGAQVVGGSGCVVVGVHGGVACVKTGCIGVRCMGLRLNWGLGWETWSLGSC